MRFCSLLALSTLLAWPLIASAEHAKIDLCVLRAEPESGTTTDEATATADQEPPVGGVKARPLFKVKASEPLVLQFIFTNTYPHGEVKDVTVRYFVVREDKAGQKHLPDLEKGTVTQGRFKMNFKPKCRVGARVEFLIKTSGAYLIRVQTTNTNSDHEHFSAIDLLVE